MASKAPEKTTATATKAPRKPRGTEAIGTDSSGSDMLSLMMRTGSLASRGQIAFESKYLEAQDNRFSSRYPAIDIALSGRIKDGGMAKGVLILAGKSKHFKSKYGVILMAEFQRNHPNGICLFYDNEGGTRKSYFTQHGVDLKRVIHIPFMTLEELRNDMVQKFEALPENSEVPIFVFTDSLGTSGTKKELEDVLNDENKGEMARAKVISGFMRLMSPYHIIKNIYSVIINHTYLTIGTYTKEVMGGGGKAELIANDIWFFSKEEIKEKSVDNAEGKDVYAVTGNIFYIAISKSRVVTAGRKIPIKVDYNGGIAKYTAMLEIAKSLGVVNVRAGGSKGNVAEYTDQNTGEVIVMPVKQKWDGDIQTFPDIDRNEEFWEGCFANTNLNELIIDEYTFDGVDSNIIPLD